MLADLPAVLALVRQHRADAHAEDVLTGHTRLNAAAVRVPPAARGPRRTASSSPSCPGPTPPAAGAAGEVAVGLAVLGLDPLSLVLGNPQVTVDTFVVHREHRRRGAGVLLLAAAAAYAEETGAAHVVAAVGGHEAERQRFFARMGFAPLTTRRIVALDSLDALARGLAARRRRRSRAPRRSPRRRPRLRAAPARRGRRRRGLTALSRPSDQAGQPAGRGRCGPPRR